MGIFHPYFQNNIFLTIVDVVQDLSVIIGGIKII